MVSNELSQFAFWFMMKQHRIGITTHHIHANEKKATIEWTRDLKELDKHGDSKEVSLEFRLSRKPRAQQEILEIELGSARSRWRRLEWRWWVQMAIGRVFTEQTDDLGYVCPQSSQELWQPNSEEDCVIQAKTSAEEQLGCAIREIDLVSGLNSTISLLCLLSSCQIHPLPSEHIPLSARFCPSRNSRCRSAPQRMLNYQPTTIFSPLWSIFLPHSLAKELNLALNFQKWYASWFCSKNWQNRWNQDEAISQWWHQLKSSNPISADQSSPSLFARSREFWDPFPNSLSVQRDRKRTLRVKWCWDELSTNSKPIEQLNQSTADLFLSKTASCIWSQNQSASISAAAFRQWVNEEVLQWIVRACTSEKQVAIRRGVELKNGHRNRQNVGEMFSSDTERP